MSQGFVNKIVNTILKILEKIKFKKKSNTMPDNQQPAPVQPQSTITLGANTVVQFTLKGFIATILSILGIFASFYFMVFEPRADKVEEYQTELMAQQKIVNAKEFKAINDGIRTNNKSLVDLGIRFNDLSEAVKDIGESSGGFGGRSSAMTHTDEPAVDPRLAENRHQ